METQYVIAWLIAIVATALLLATLLWLFRAVFGPFLKTLSAALLTTWLLLPAPVPQYEGHYAPAFVVLVFEAFFQTEGSPDLVLRLLGVGTLFVAGGVCIGFGVRRFLHARSGASGTGAEEASENA